MELLSILKKRIYGTLRIMILRSNTNQNTKNLFLIIRKKSKEIDPIGKMVNLQAGLFYLSKCIQLGLPFARFPFAFHRVNQNGNTHLFYGQSILSLDHVFCPRQRA